MLWTTALAALMGMATGAQAWHHETHEAAARYAVAALPNDLPGFFRAGGEGVAQFANDPDAFKHPKLPELAAGESPEHFFDLEMLKGEPIPANRYAYIALCEKLGVKPEKIGTLPYSVVEWTERLTLAFAEHRARPGDEAVKVKCFVYAGLLAHYAADLCQPLHTTIHFDGRADANGLSPRSGIHNKMDAIPHTVGVAWEKEATGLDAAPFEKLFPAIVEEIHRSNALVDRVYELEAKLPAKPSDEIAEPVKALAVERYRAAVLITARLYRTAWEQSAGVKLPEWMTPEAK
ncbi:MAG: hypothetical protein K8S99_00290 [Planctomycetes bacterium]|nr:hypothetical protein [Planctomycetota bacterium]